MTYLLYDQGGKCQLQSIELPKAARMSIKIISFELVWPQLDLKTGSWWVKPFGDQTGPPIWLWLQLTPEVTRGQLAMASSHSASQLEPKQEISDHLTFLILMTCRGTQCSHSGKFSKSYTLFLISIWLIMLSHSLDMIPFMFTCMHTSLGSMLQSYQ